ncbi:MAG: hypothetical protein WCH86_04510 [Kiritimatiellales bacterium]
MATGGNRGAVDGTAEKEYSLKVMKLLIFRMLAMLAILAGAAISVPAKDLDDALAAQKTKATRRVYSEKASLENQNLEVPRTQTEEEQELDRKLREMDAKMDSKSAPSPGQMQPDSGATVPHPVENKNWLTPALMDNDTAMAQTNETEAAWLARELVRQKELKSQKAETKESELVEKLLREKTKPPSSSPELDRLKQYQLAPPKIFGGKDKDADAPSYMTPKSGTPDPLAAIRLTPKKELSAPPPLFSPEAARISSALDKDPLRSTRSPLLNPTPGSPLRQPGSAFSSGRNTPDLVPLTPLETIKKSSPINRANPFEANPMPEMKTSIWQ